MPLICRKLSVPKYGRSPSVTSALLPWALLCPREAILPKRMSFEEPSLSTKSSSYAAPFALGIASGIVPLDPRGARLEGLSLERDALWVEIRLLALELTLSLRWEAVFERSLRYNSGSASSVLGACLVRLLDSSCSVGSLMWLEDLFLCSLG